MRIRTIEYHDSVSSTNDRIKELLKQPILPRLPVLVVASRQTSGRGRGDKRWWSAQGALMMSLGYELASLGIVREQLRELSPLVGRTVAEMLRQRLGARFSVELHWPNDVYVDGKKICGILIESPTPRYAIIGIGVNVNNRLSDVPSEYRTMFEEKPITTLIDLTGRRTEHFGLIVDFLLRFHSNLAILEKPESQRRETSG